MVPAALTRKPGPQFKDNAAPFRARVGGLAAANIQQMTVVGNQIGKPAPKAP